jgi:hypothetical protein
VIVVSPCLECAVGADADAEEEAAVDRISVKVPAGTFVWPKALLPQASSVPSARRARLWSRPASAARNWPPGTFNWLLSSKPQAATVPSLRTVRL